MAEWLDAHTNLGIQIRAVTWPDGATRVAMDGTLVERDCQWQTVHQLQKMVETIARRAAILD